jgi:acylphosphatase
VTPERGAEGRNDSGGDQAQRLEALVAGRVQGVGYRYFVVRQATRLGLTGWVANEPSGRVRCVAEGPRASLESLADELRGGPPGAWVERVDATWSPASGEFRGFDVRSGWHGGD